MIISKLLCCFSVAHLAQVIYRLLRVLPVPSPSFSLPSQLYFFLFPFLLICNFCPQLPLLVSRSHSNADDWLIRANKLRCPFAKPTYLAA